MKPEVKAILDQVRSTADFGYVAFSDINDTNELGDNALHCVIVWGDYAAAKILIKNGINIHQPGEFGFTPLRHAIDFEQPEIAQLLLAHGAVPCTGPEKFDRERHTKHLQRLYDSIAELGKKLDEHCEG